MLTSTAAPPSLGYRWPTRRTAVEMIKQHNEVERPFVSLLFKDQFDNIVNFGFANFTNTSFRVRVTHFGNDRQHIKRSLFTTHRRYF